MQENCTRKRLHKIDWHTCKFLVPDDMHKFLLQVLQVTWACVAGTTRFRVKVTSQTMLTFLKPVHRLAGFFFLFLLTTNGRLTSLRRRRDVLTERHHVGQSLLIFLIDAVCHTQSIHYCNYSGWTKPLVVVVQAQDQDFEFQDRTQVQQESLANAR